MKAEAVMKKDIVKVPLGTTLEGVMNVLFDEDISGVLVVDENDKLKGLVSEKDIYRRLYPNYEQLYSRSGGPIDFENMEKMTAKVRDMVVDEIMIPDVYTVSVDEPILSVGAIMLARKINRLPVLNVDGDVVGIISRRNIYKAILRKQFGK